MSEHSALDRLQHLGPLDPVIERICVAYGLGKLLHFSVIEVGYEDCNTIIETESGKFVAKIFSKGRSTEDISRYSQIMQNVVAAGVNHPEMCMTKADELLYIDILTGLSMVLMRFIEGKTFLELDRAPNAEERALVIEQAVKVGKVEFHPVALFDPWAIPNIEAMFEKVRRFIQPGDLELVTEVINRFWDIDLEQLPHCFVHGDFTKANVLLGNDGKIYILDFSVSNWYPRIQELAVIAANLLYDEKVCTSLGERCEVLTSEYGRLNPLTEEEIRCLPIYALAGVAMEFMGAHLEKFIKGNDSKETEYWLELGRNGLRRELMK